MTDEDIETKPVERVAVDELAPRRTENKLNAALSKFGEAVHSAVGALDQDVIQQSFDPQVTLAINEKFYAAGWPKEVPLTFVMWPMQCMTIAVSALVQAAPPHKIEDIIRYAFDAFQIGESGPPLSEKFDLECVCGDATCARSELSLDQLHSSLFAASDALLGILSWFDKREITPEVDKEYVDRSVSIAMLMIELGMRSGVAQLYMG